MNAMLAEPLDPLIDELDNVYQSALDRLEQQTREVIIVDQQLRRLLDQSADDPSVLNWDPQRAINPRNAFRALALRIVATAQGSVSRAIALSSVDYEDLLAWPSEPARIGTSPTEDFLRCIEFARTQSLAAFWNRLQTRIAPDRNPEQAIAQAVEDLKVAFAVDLPENLVVPYTRHGAAFSLALTLDRVEGDLEWVISAMQLQAITRANHALSTLSLLDKHVVSADAIYEATAAIQNRLRASFRQYRQREYFHAGPELRVFFCRDHIDYRMQASLFDRLRTLLSDRIAGLEFVPAHIVLRSL